MERIEVLTTFDEQDAVFRSKILGLQKALQHTHVFEPFSRKKPCQAVLLRVNLSKPVPPEILEALHEKSQTTPVHLFVPDLEAKHGIGLSNLNGLVHVYLVPTPEMQTLMNFQVAGAVEYLFDPIDFGLQQHRERIHVGPEAGKPLRMAWFGYPESYAKSMLALEPVFNRLAESGEAVLTVYTAPAVSTSKPYGMVRPYEPKSFLHELDQHDVVVLSHLATDFSFNTFCKSDNKSILAIHRGLPVIASHTPAYARLLSQFGLQDFLFNSPASLQRAVLAMRSPDVRNSYLQRSQSLVTANYNFAEMGRQWLEIFKKHSPVH